MRVLKKLMTAAVTLAVTGALLFSPGTSSTADAASSCISISGVKYDEATEVSYSKLKDILNSFGAKDVGTKCSEWKSQLARQGVTNPTFLVWLHHDKAASDKSLSKGVKVTDYETAKSNRSGSKQGTVTWNTIGYKIAPRKLPSKSGDYNVDDVEGFIVDQLSVTAKNCKKTNSLDGDFFHAICKQEVDAGVAKFANDDKYKETATSRNFANLAGKDGVSTLYMQGIVQIHYTNGKLSAPVKSLKVWKGAAGWSNPSTFVEHYNVPFSWPAGKINVNVHYIESLGSGDHTIKDLDKEVKVKGVPALSDFKAGGLLNNKTILQDKITIEADKSESGKEEVWALSQVFVMRSSEYKKKDFPKRQLTSAKKVAAAYEDKEAEVEVTFNNVTKMVNKGDGLQYEYYANMPLSPPTYKDYLKGIKAKNIATYAEDMEIFFGYVKTEEPDDPEGITIKYEYQEYKNGKSKWEKAKDNVKIKIDPGETFDRTFKNTLADSSKPYYGIYSVTIEGQKKDSNDWKTIKNTIEGSKDKVQNESGKYVFYDTAEWKVYKEKVRHVKFKMPKDTKVRITVRYAARLPYSILLYDYEGGTATLKDTKISEKDKRVAPGKTVKVTSEDIPTTSPSGKPFNSVYSSSGPIAPFGGEPSNGWKPNELPIAKTDPVKTPEAEFTMPDEPLYVVVVYGDDPPSPPPGGPPDGDGDPPPPEPRDLTYKDDESVVLTWEHSGGMEHTQDDSTKGSTATNIDFQCRVSADEGKSDAFDVEQGIPSSEYEKVDASVEDYQTCGQFRKHHITVYAPVTVHKLYYWYTYTTDSDGHSVSHYHSSRVERTYTIEREVDYYTCDWLKVWHPKDLTVWNGSFPDPSYVAIDPRNNPGAATKGKVNACGQHKDPELYNNLVDLGTECGYPPSDVNWLSVAEENVGQLKARNDKVEFWDDTGSKVTLSDPAWSESPWPQSGHRSQT